MGETFRIDVFISTDYRAIKEAVTPFVPRSIPKDLYKDTLLLSGMMILKFLDSCFCSYTRGGSMLIWQEGCRFSKGSASLCSLKLQESLLRIRYESKSVITFQKKILYVFFLLRNAHLLIYFKCYVSLKTRMVILNCKWWWYKIRNCFLKRETMT